MFKTLYSKIAIIFIVILLISTSVTGGMLYFFLGNFASQQKENLLNETGNRINFFLRDYVENMNNPIVQSIFMNILNSYSENTESIIWIASNDGDIGIIANERSIPIEIMRKLQDESGKLRLPDARQYNKVMQGQDVKEIGDFFGLFKDTNVSWLTIEKSFKYEGKVLGAVYLHTPIPEISKARTTVFRFYIFSVSISVVISILLVYFFSLRLSKPLKLINNAAKQIANGEFSKRLAISSEDEIGELAKSFNNMAGALEKLEEMRKGFIANVSHELRTPMTSIHGFVEGILDGTIPPDRQGEYLSIVRDEIRRLNRLTNDLLDLARMESGETKLTLVNFDINELIRRCIIKLESLILQKNIEIEANFGEGVTTVNADVDSIERVVLNLIHNAIKFVQKDGKITITTTRLKNKVQVCIQDNGIGIGSNEIGLIWERFYKSDKSRSKEKGGTGLGLAIVKNILNEHKQEIWVESELGKGTEFYFTLNPLNDDKTNI